MVPMPATLFFCGRDGSKAFITGKFSEDLTDDVTGLTPKQLRGIKHWIDFYHRDYTFVGVLQGRYYDQHGNPTPALKEVEDGITKGDNLHELAEEEKKKHPPCNSRWQKGVGSEVWCSTDSGGILRDWIGFPRQYFEPVSDGIAQRAEKPRCICVPFHDFNYPNIREYPSCPSTERRCATSKG